MGLHDVLSGQSGLYALGALSEAERTAFEAHLAECADCAADVRSLLAVADALGGATPPAQPSDAVRARVLAAVSQAAQTGRIASPPRAAGMRWWLALAASLALAVGAIVYAIPLRRAVIEAQFTTAVMAAPDLARIDLAGQPLAPQASARAFWSRSRGLVFTASHLPPLPSGRIYQLWIVGAGGPVSAGLIRPDAAGAVHVVAATPPDLPKPVAMAVTIEPDGGVAAPTGEKYLVGVPGS